MSKKKREAVLKAEQNGMKELPKEGETSTEIQNKKEDNDMDLKKNGWQKLGEAFIEHGNKKAEYASEHPTGSKVITGLKVAGGVGLGVLAVIAGVAKHKKKTAETVETGVDYYDDFDEEEVEDAVTEDTSYQDEADEVESTDFETETKEVE